MHSFMSSLLTRASRGWRCMQIEPGSVKRTFLWVQRYECHTSLCLLPKNLIHLLQLSIPCCGRNGVWLQALGMEASVAGSPTAVYRHPSKYTFLRWGRGNYSSGSLWHSRGSSNPINRADTNSCPLRLQPLDADMHAWWESPSTSVKFLILLMHGVFLLHKLVYSCSWQGRNRRASQEAEDDCWGRLLHSLKHSSCLCSCI